MWPSLGNQLHLKYWLLRKLNRESKGKDTKMSKLPLLAFLLIGASVSVMLFLSKTPFDSFRPLMLQIFPSVILDQSWNEAKKFIFHPDCRCHRLIPEQQASCYSWKPHFRRIPPHWTRRTEVSMNTPVGSNVGVRTILILLPRILIFWKGFLVQLPDNRSWFGSKGGHCGQLHQRAKGHWDWTQSKEDICCQHGLGNAWQWGKIIVWS